MKPSPLHENDEVDPILTVAKTLEIKETSRHLLAIIPSEDACYFFNLESKSFFDFFRKPSRLSDYVSAVDIEMGSPDGIYLNSLSRFLLQVGAFQKAKRCTQPPPPSATYLRPYFFYCEKISDSENSRIQKHESLHQWLLKVVISVCHTIKWRLSYLLNSMKLSLLRASLGLKGNKKKIVGIILPERMGDVVASEPIARWVRENRKDGFIVWCVRKKYRELVDSNPHIDFVLSVSCLRECDRLIATNKFDNFLRLVPYGKNCWGCYYFPQIYQDPSINMANYLLYGSLLSAYSLCGGLPPLDGSPKVYLSYAISQRVDRIGLPPKFIAVHPASQEPWKDWSMDKWELLVSKIRRRWKIPVIELGKMSDKSGIRGATLLHRKLSILEMAGVIQRASLFVGVDSGPAHLAHAVGKESVVLMGRYGAIWNYVPFSGDFAKGLATLVFAKKTVSEIGIDSVLNAIERMMATRFHEKM